MQIVTEFAEFPEGSLHLREPPLKKHAGSTTWTATGAADSQQLADLV